MADAGRARPNILVIGTAGTGKTTTCSLLAEATNLRHINVGELVRPKDLHDGWDEVFECHIINENLVCNEIEDKIKDGGNMVDYHGGYMGPKLMYNIKREIFQVLLEKAKASYAE